MRFGALRRGVCEESCRLGCDAVQSGIKLREPTVLIFGVVYRKRRHAVISSEKSVTFCQTTRRHPKIIYKLHLRTPDLTWQDVTGKRDS